MDTLVLSAEGTGATHFGSPMKQASFWSGSRDALAVASGQLLKRESECDLDRLRAAHSDGPGLLGVAPPSSSLAANLQVIFRCTLVTRSRRLTDCV
uniref:Uncharacterized protein n=1 Tax=Plectus sambesii TaxID=2011161 RepID=A0A914UQ15_9BILA